MFHKTLTLAGWGILLVLLQSLIFNHIHILGYATPLPYIYFMVKLPDNTSRTMYLILGFALGMTIDIFSNTPGMTAAALCVIGLITPWILMAFSPKEKGEEILYPSVRTMGAKSFYLYAFSITFAHCTLFFSIEFFSFFHWQMLLLKIAASTLLTFLLIVAFEQLRPRHKKTTA